MVPATGVTRRAMVADKEGCRAMVLNLVKPCPSHRRFPRCAPLAVASVAMVAAVLLELPAWSREEISPAAAGDLPDTMGREVDPVIITGSAVPSLLGSPLDHLGCFAARGSSWHPVPCQVDERTEEGEYVFTSGPEANPDDGDGVLSSQDEWVLQVGDAGERTAHPPWGEGFRHGVEIEVSDPIDGGRGWFYLAVYDRPPAHAARDYVGYDVSRKRVCGTTYELGFSSQAPIVFDTLVLKKEAGGPGIDLVDRMKIRLTGKIWDTIDIYKTEDDYTSDLMGYIDGPVRVVRRTRNRLVLFWKIPSPSAIQDNFFYGTFFEFPVAVTLPFDMDTFLSACDLRISLDGEAAAGQWFLNSRNRTPVPMDGEMSSEEERLDMAPADWSITFGNSPGNRGGWVNRLSIVSNVDLKPDLFYVDQVSRPDPPETFPGQIGNVGYQVRNLNGLTRGTHVLSSVLYSFSEYVPGIEKRFLAIQDAPVRIRVSRQF